MDSGIGNRVNQLRMKKGRSLREMAELSGLNINTSSMIENNKTSPSVATLQKLAAALEIPIVDFFTPVEEKDQVVLTRSEKRDSSLLGQTRMQSLTSGFFKEGVRAFVITIPNKEEASPHAVDHSGFEFVYCLSGKLIYHIQDEVYYLEAGDSLIFDSSIDHCWENSQEDTPAQFLLVLADEVPNQATIQRHILAGCYLKEKCMKIAVITDDHKTVSQHFGRAPFYLVFSIENGKILGQEVREKLGHAQLGGHEHGEHDEHHSHNEHGFSEEHHARHSMMAEAISDCEVLLCGGMGRGAYESMRMLGITPVVTTIVDAEEAVKQYLAGTLQDHTEKLH
jgi:transcriptional regulator with XRE-family HTH domain/predicted Fe-Mo cluster-binding NifX family protein